MAIVEVPSETVVGIGDTVRTPVAGEYCTYFDVADGKVKVTTDTETKELVVVEPGNTIPQLKTQAQTIDANNSFVFDSDLGSFVQILGTVPLPGDLIPATGVIDPTNVSTNEANLINGNLTDLTYNNSSTGTVNKELPAIDLGSAQEVEQLNLTWWTNVSYSASNYSIQGNNSATAGGWTTVASGLDSTGISGLVEIPIPPTTFRYWRVFCVQGNNTSFCVISELEALGTSPGNALKPFTAIDGVSIEDVGGKLQVNNNSSFAIPFTVSYLE